MFAQWPVFYLRRWSWQQTESKTGLHHNVRNLTLLEMSPTHCLMHQHTAWCTRTEHNWERLDLSRSRKSGKNCLTAWQNLLQAFHWIIAEQSRLLLYCKRAKSSNTGFCFLFLREHSFLVVPGLLSFGLLFQSLLNAIRKNLRFSWLKIRF